MSRRPIALLLAAALSAAALTGCSVLFPSCEPPAGGSAVDAVSVTAAAADGAAPVVDFPTPLISNGLEVRTVTRGDGPQVGEGQYIAVSLLGFTGDRDPALGSLGGAGFDGASTLGLVVDPELTAFAPGLLCAHEGDRLLISLPIADIPESINTAGLNPDASLIYLVDIERVYPRKAEGAPQWITEPGLPIVVTAPDGTPGITAPAGEPDGEFHLAVLRKGDGPRVGESSRVTLHYSLMLWGTDTILQSTWASGTPATVTPEGVIAGFRDTLLGQTVGSQVLAVVPPELGYGDQQSGSIPPGSTLIFVIDILGVD